MLCQLPSNDRSLHVRTDLPQLRAVLPPIILSKSFPPYSSRSSPFSQVFHNHVPRLELRVYLPLPPSAYSLASAVFPAPPAPSTPTPSTYLVPCVFAWYRSEIPFSPECFTRNSPRFTFKLFLVSLKILSLSLSIIASPMTLIGLIEDYSPAIIASSVRMADLLGHPFFKLLARP